MTGFELRSELRIESAIWQYQSFYTEIPLIFKHNNAGTVQRGDSSPFIIENALAFW
jgi:hypothetical protein